MMNGRAQMVYRNGRIDFARKNSLGELVSTKPKKGKSNDIVAKKKDKLTALESEPKVNKKDKKKTIQPENDKPKELSDVELRVKKTRKKKIDDKHEKSIYEEVVQKIATQESKMSSGDKWLSQVGGPIFQNALKLYRVSKQQIRSGDPEATRYLSNAIATLTVLYNTALVLKLEREFNTLCFGYLDEFEMDAMLVNINSDSVSVLEILVSWAQLMKSMQTQQPLSSQATESESQTRNPNKPYADMRALVSPDGENCLFFRDVSGMDGPKKIIQEKFINRFLMPSYYSSVSSGLILYGAPGTGKTYMVKALVNEFARSVSAMKKAVLFFEIKAADLKGSFHGETEKKIKNVFLEARRQAKLCIGGNIESALSFLFIDEIDAVAARRKAKKDKEEVGDKLAGLSVNALLPEIDGISSTRDVIIIGATNNIEDLDPAMIRAGRLETHIYLPFPKPKEIKDAVIKELKKYVQKGTVKSVSRDVESKTDCGRICIPASQTGSQSDLDSLAIVKYMGFSDESDEPFRMFRDTANALEGKAYKMAEVIELVNEFISSNSESSKHLPFVKGKLKSSEPFLVHKHIAEEWMQPGSILQSSFQLLSPQNVCYKLNDGEESVPNMVTIDETKWVLVDDAYLSKNKLSFSQLPPIPSNSLFFLESEKTFSDRVPILLRLKIAIEYSEDSQKLDEMRRVLESAIQSNTEERVKELCKCLLQAMEKTINNTTLNSIVYIQSFIDSELKVTRSWWLTASYVMSISDDFLDVVFNNLSNLFTTRNSDCESDTKFNVYSDSEFVLKTIIPRVWQGKIETTFPLIHSCDIVEILQEKTSIDNLFQTSGDSQCVITEGTENVAGRLEEISFADKPLMKNFSLKAAALYELQKTKKLNNTNEKKRYDTIRNDHEAGKNK